MSYGLELDDERVQLAFLDGPREPALLYGDVVETARSEAGPEVPKARRDHPYDGEPDVGSRLIEDENLNASGRCNPLTEEDVFLEIV